MKYGIDLFCFLYGNGKKGIDFHVDLAVAAEDAGWDGFFIWDHIWAFWEGTMGCVDPWIVMAAVAAKTDELKIGPMVTPIPRRRPSKLARETVTLDTISNGRLILGVGLGGSRELSLMNEETNPKILAEMAEEHLEILMGLWSGEEFNYDGKYYKIDTVKFQPTPIQKPRIRVWGAGTWPKKGPFRRAAKLDGVIPLSMDYREPLTPHDFRDMNTYMRKHGMSAPYDVVEISFDATKSNEKKRRIIDFQDAGVNWWLELVSDWNGGYEKIRDIITQCPTQI